MFSEAWLADYQKRRQAAVRTGGGIVLPAKPITGSKPGRTAKTARTNETPLLVRIGRQSRNRGNVGKPLNIGFHIVDQSDMVFRTDLASVFQYVLIQDPSVRKTGDSRHCRHQQREQGAGHFLADFRSEPADSFPVCLLMRTRRGVSLVQANPRLCKALIDRLTDQAHIITTGADSYRFRRTTAQRKAAKS